MPNWRSVPTTPGTIERKHRHHRRSAFLTTCAVTHHRTMLTLSETSLGLKVAKMKRPITLVPFVLIAALTLSITLADRMKERALHDRFSFDDSGTTESAAR